MNSQLHSLASTPTTVFDMANVKKKSTTIKALPSREPTARPRFRSSKLVWLGAVVVVLTTGAFFRFQYASSPESASVAGPVARQVNVTMPERAVAGDIELPGTILAYQATDLYARASGFVKTWKPEIGTLVKKGDVLAEIETPELDQELSQVIALHRQGQAEHLQAIAELQEARADVALAEANVVKSKANVDFATSQAARYETLLQRKILRGVAFQGEEDDAEHALAKPLFPQAFLVRRELLIQRLFRNL